MGAVELHHRSVSAAAGSSLCGRGSGVSLLQSHRRENTRLAGFTAVCTIQQIQTTDCCSAYVMQRNSYCIYVVFYLPYFNV